MGIFRVQTVSSTPAIASSSNPATSARVRHGAGPESGRAPIFPSEPQRRIALYRVSSNFLLKQRPISSHAMSASGHLRTPAGEAPGAKALYEYTP